MLAVVLQRVPADAAAAHAPIHVFEQGCENIAAAMIANPLLHMGAAKFVLASELSYTIGLRDGVDDRAGLFDSTGPLATGEEDDEASRWATWWWVYGGRHGKPRTTASI
eukprot:SAG31_NODE_4982_length_2820_cov_3.084160_4_plen_109_part_00